MEVTRTSQRGVYAGETGHPFVQSFEPGESWYWNHETDELYEGGPELAAPLSRPDDQPAPGPAGRVPADWAKVLRAQEPGACPAPHP
ncbi:hypothetical protein [Streptomyces sp. NPDC002788]